MSFCLASTLFAFAGAAYLLLDLQLIRGLRKLRKEVDLPLLDSPYITVLIAARNEEHALPHVLNALLAQDYPSDRIQIVVINDRSEDGTEKVLRNYAVQFDRIESINVTDVEPGMSPKKHALMKGLEIARGEWIAVTDADCIMGPQWLSTLSREFSDQTGMVLGFTAYTEPETGVSIGHGTQALEFVSYGIISAGLVGLGFPVISNANNLAYRRKAYDAAALLRKHTHIVSGDDDFVLQAIHATKKWDIRYCVQPEALMRTSPPDSWNHFWEQRKRWASKCLLYGPRQVVFLAVVFAFYASIPVLIVAGIWNAHWLGLALILFAVKTFADLLVMVQGLRLFKLRGLMQFFPATALLHIPLILAAVVTGTLRGFTWKGQKLLRKV